MQITPEQPLAESCAPSQHASPLPYIAGVLIPLLIFFLMRWGYLCVGSEYEPDCFYHAAIVEGGPSVFFAKTFPWMSQATWADHFSDKELLFHCLLWGFTKVLRLFQTWEESYPFHFQVLFFDGILLTLLQVILYRRRIRHPWLYSLLFITIYPPYTFRFLSLRAYLLSISIATSLLLLLFTTHQMEHPRRRWLLMLLFGFIAAWSYSSPHLLLTTVLPFAVADFLAERKLWKLLDLPLGFLAGILLGLTLHPQFPNTYLMFKVQCIDVILAFFLHLEKMPVTGGNEFYISTIKLAWVTRCLYPLLPVGTALLLWLQRKTLFRENWRQNRRFNGLLFASAFNTILAYGIFRFNEYAMIPQILLLAVLIQNQCKTTPAPQNDAQNEPPAPLPQVHTTTKNAKSCQSSLLQAFQKWERGMLVFTLLSLGICFYNFIKFPSFGIGRIPAIGVANWLRNPLQKKKIPYFIPIQDKVTGQTIQQIQFRYEPVAIGETPVLKPGEQLVTLRPPVPAGTRIANLVWSDFPLLYYAMPEYRFSWGLDPAFAWHKDHRIPEMFNKIDRAENAASMPPARETKETFQAQYLFISKGIRSNTTEILLAQKLYEADYAMVYQDMDGFLFDLDLSIEQQTRGIHNPPIQWKKAGAPQGR